jgi:hypothetical protein
MIESRTQKHLREQALNNKGRSDNASVERLLSEIEKLRGDPGKDGHTPTEPELLRLIKPLIPTAIDGHTPTEQEIIDIIVPFLHSVKDGLDGKDGNNGKDGKDGSNGKDGKPGKDGKDGAPGRNGKDAVLPSLYELAINTILYIEKLEGDNRINYTAIKGLEKLVEKVVNNQLVGHVGGGGPGLVYTDLSLSGTGIPGDPLRVIGGGGTTIEIPTGAIDGTNVTFTVTHIPKYIVLNGATYFENDGYTRVGLTVTMLVVPMAGSTLRSAY